MKIAIVGAHGVGKTSLSQKLSQILNLPIIPDVAVEAFQKGFPISENTPPEVQFWMFAKHLEYERNLSDKWIADKCLIDYSVYADVIFDDHRITSLLAEMVRNNVFYDLIFYLPIEFPIEDNGIRSLDVNFQRAINDRYLKTLDDWGLKYYILSGTLAERLKTALNIIANQYLDQ